MVEFHCVTAAGRNVVLICGMAASIYAAYWSLRMAWAGDGDADMRLKLATAQEAAGGDPTAALEGAAALDPGNATVWMRLGLRAEMHGDLRTADRDLLEAARVSRQFEPRWTLANYYFRRGDQAHFWPWVNEALRMAYGDCRPIFQLCWNMSQDAGAILSRAIPERRAVLNAYLGYLVEENRLAAAGPVAVKLAVLATPEDRPALINWCDRNLGAGSVAEALAVWNTLCTRRLLPYAPLDPNDAPLTDGDFASAPLGGGFGWRCPSVAGVASGRNASPAYAWFSFSGKQPESCAPLAQLLPLEPGARYRLRFEYRTSEIPPEGGLRWRVLDARTGADLAAGSPWLSSPIWKHEEVSIATTPDTALARLALTYQRLPGATRIEGSLSLRRLALERLP